MNNRYRNFGSGWGTIALAIFALISGVGIIAGNPVPAFDLESIIASSDVIAVVQPLGKLGKVRVLSVIQGTGIASGDRVNVDVMNSVAHSALQSNAPVCIFLKKGKPGSFEVANEYYPCFRVDAEQRVVAEAGRVGVERELIHGLRSKDQEVVSDAVEWLMQMNAHEGEQEIIALYEEGNRSPAIQAAALQLQVPSGKKEVLRKAIDFLAKAAEEKETPKWRWGLAWSFSKIGKTDDVAFLNQLLITAPQDVAKALCFSVQEWADKTSIPFLMDVMRRMDEDGKYRCVLCLGRLTGKAVPSYREFMTNQSGYVSEWEDWFGVQGRD